MQITEISVCLIFLFHFNNFSSLNSEQMNVCILKLCVWFFVIERRRWKIRILNSQGKRSMQNEFLFFVFEGDRRLWYVVRWNNAPTTNFYSLNCDRLGIQNQQGVCLHIERFTSVLFIEISSTMVHTLWKVLCFIPIPHCPVITILDIVYRDDATESMSIIDPICQLVS